MRYIIKGSEIVEKELLIPEGSMSSASSIAINNAYQVGSSIAVEGVIHNTLEIRPKYKDGETIKEITSEERFIFYVCLPFYQENLLVDINQSEAAVSSTEGRLLKEKHQVRIKQLFLIETKLFCSFLQASNGVRPLNDIKENLKTLEIEKKYAASFKDLSMSSPVIAVIKKQQVIIYAKSVSCYSELLLKKMFHSNNKFVVKEKKLELNFSVKINAPALHHILLAYMSLEPNLIFKKEQKKTILLTIPISFHYFFYNPCINKSTVQGEKTFKQKVHFISKGDNIGKISRSLGLASSAVIENNPHLKYNYCLQPGEKVYYRKLT